MSPTGSLMGMPTLSKIRTTSRYQPAGRWRQRCKSAPHDEKWFGRTHHGGKEREGACGLQQRRNVTETAVCKLEVYEAKRRKASAAGCETDRRREPKKVKDSQMATRSQNAMSRKVKRATKTAFVRSDASR